MSVKKVFALIFSIMGVILLSVCICLVLLYRSSVDLQVKAERRYLSYLLADEMRQSSDDLTRMARVYVVTGDEKYLQIYNAILDIRNGKKAWPIAYERIYWDFVADDGKAPRGEGETVALNQLMRRAGFTEEEFALLSESERNSNELVELETVAMEAIAGRISDEARTLMEAGETPEAFARRIVHDARYHSYKAVIMRSIDAFLEQLDLRTAGEIAAVQARQKACFAAMIFGILILFIALAASYRYIRRNISAPISALLSGFGRNQDGTYRLRAVKVGVSNDVGVLAGSLNGVVGQLQTFLSHTREAAESVTTASQHLYSGTDRTSQMTEEVATAIANVSADISSQIGEMNESMRILRDMIENLRTAAESAEGTMNQTDRAEALISRGVEIVRDAIAQMHRIEGTVNASAGVVAKLGERSDEIVQIIDTISGIADQTNLLALNAAIEAARAGDHGRGFAVVAEEVRSLAESSQEAAKKIASLISEIRTDTQSAVTAMEEGTKEVKTGAEAVDGAGSVFRDIAALIRDVSRDVRSLSTLVNDLASGGERVAGAVEASGQVLERTERETTKISGAGQTQLASVEEIVAACRELSTLAQDLQNGVTMFTI